MAAKTESEVLAGTDDEYGGVMVHMNEYELMDSATFLSSLTSSIAHWKLQGKKGVWIKLPIRHVNLVEAAVKQGFWFHHAEPNYVMLVYWIPKSAHTLPENATHRLGIGAFLINQNREVLVVQEKGGQYRGTGVWKLPTGAVDEGEDIYAAAVREVKEETGVLVVQEKSGHLQGTGVWKFPTGVVDEGEDIYAAAVREVREETGIDSEFVEILAFRQSHKSFFDKSDLFFVCMLQPLSFDIQKQEQEIEAAQWMSFEEYAAQPFVQNNELLKYVNEICKSKMEGEYSGFSPVPTTSFSDQKSYLYLNSSSNQTIKQLNLVYVEFHVVIKQLNLTCVFHLF